MFGDIKKGYLKKKKEFKMWFLVELVPLWIEYKKHFKRYFQ